MVEWIDTTNIAEWTVLSEVAEWAGDGGFICRNVGYLIHEDSDCVVLAARAAFRATPPQVGLYERVPKSAITNRWDLATSAVSEESA